MRIPFFSLFIALAMCGCVSLNDEAFMMSKPATQGERALTDIYKVKIGMRQDMVEAIMGRTFTVGYKQGISIEGALEPITIDQPVRVEDFKKNGRAYTVVYYFTSVKKADGLISEDELTPLIFEDGKLIGKGADYYYKLKTRQK